MSRKENLIKLSIAHSYLEAMSKHYPNLSEPTSRILDILNKEDKGLDNTMSRLIHKYINKGVAEFKTIDNEKQIPVLIIDLLSSVLIGYENLGGKYSTYRKTIKKVIKLTCDALDHVIDYGRQDEVYKASDKMMIKLFGTVEV